MWKDDAYLLDILLAAQDAREFATDLDWQAFSASKVSSAYRNDHPNIPWSKMIGMRNRLIHDYNQIRLDIVWDVVEKELPKLIALIKPLIPPENEDQ